MSLDLEGKSVVVLGLGISGRAAFDFLLAQGSKVYAIDDNFLSLQKIPEIQMMISKGLKIVDRTIDLSKLNIDLVVVSPGISKEHPVYVQALEQKIQILGEVELAFCFLAQKKCKCIGITGTNGKTTVTLLLEHILNENGIQAKAVGNSGFPLTALLRESDVKLSETVFFIELSSFQLETAESKILDAAVILNIKEDHLDRYSSFEEYAKAKINIFDCVKPGGSCYIEEECYSNFANLLNERTLLSYGYKPANFIYSNSQDLIIKGKAKMAIPLEYGGVEEKRGLLANCEAADGVICDDVVALATTEEESASDAASQFAKRPLFSSTPPYRSQRNHDLENMMAAYGIAMELGITCDGFIKAFASFKKPSHRLEFVSKIGDITFIDDSKATNVDAVIRAVESITSPIILIAGGVDKGGSYAPWKKVFAGKVLKVCTIGQAADKIKKDLEGEVQIEHFQTLESAVIHAATVAKKNETVLLSPGCSSFDMFSSYAHRGTCFQEIVHELVKK